MPAAVWLVWASCAGLAALSTTNPFYLLPLFATAYAIYVAHGRAGPALRSFRVFALFGVIALLSRTALVFVPGAARISAPVVAAAALEGLRLAVLLAIFGAFNSVTDPLALIKATPRRFHEPALAAALALSLAPRTIGAVQRVRTAQRLRGIEVRRARSLPALVVPVLEGGMEEALTLAESMDARGHGHGRRTRYRTSRWSSADWSMIVIAVGCAALFLAAAVVHRDDLTGIRFPLGWPDARFDLTIAALGFAAPVLIGRKR